MEDQIELRPVFKHVVLCFVVAIMGTVVGFVPYIAGTSHEELQFSFEALVMTIACCLLLFGIGMLVLLFMQRDVRERYLEHDEQMNAVSSFLSSEASRLEGKASSYATFRKRWQVMERQWHLDMPTRKAKELGYQSALLKTRIRDLDEIARNCEVAMGSCAVGYDVTWETVSDWLKDDSFYSLCDVRRHSYFEDDSAYGQKSFMDMPYAFMSRAHLEELDLE